MNEIQAVASRVKKMSDRAAISEPAEIEILGTPLTLTTYSDFPLRRLGEGQAGGGRFYKHADRHDASARSDVS